MNNEFCTLWTKPDRSRSSKDFISFLSEELLDSINVGRRILEANLIFWGKGERFKSAAIIPLYRVHYITNMSWIDLVILLSIFAVSYWIAFVSGASKIFKKSNHRRHKKTDAQKISGSSYKNPFKKVSFDDLISCKNYLFV